MAQLVMTAGRAGLSALQAAGPALANAAANLAVNALIGGRRREGPRLPEIPVQTSTDGAPMARIWGRARIAGQVIWASRYLEHATKTSAGGKGGPSQVDYAYSISLAVGLCEGEIAGIGRVWANGALLDTSALAMRVYPGSEDQMPDALIEAVEGGDVPAFRGTAYVVFEDLPLDEFGHRIPNLSFEIFRPLRDGVQLEDRVAGVNLIPGSGEFAYAPEAVMRVLGPGRETAENRNNGRGVSDFIASIDDLERDLPNCRSVQLVVSWFGDDLRCGHCQIRPGVETRDKLTRPLVWSVAGEDRASAYLISGEAGRPVYGGTPDDASIIAAITELRARGFAVTLYPFILMDIPAGNGRPDPWGAAEQAVFPWRGRITCHPAPGLDGTVDESAAAEAQVADFFGMAGTSDYTVSGGSVSYSGPAEWGLNRFILHCAALAQAAGGVDGFLIGSELAALTTVRGAGGSYPAVTALKALAGEARALLGPSTQISYAADWTEYSGHQPGGGAKLFHLDPLWSDANIDAVAIDWYVPLSDWRDGAENLDAAFASGPHDRDYLASNMTAGEGFDWYYASEADRVAQIRTPIVDGVHGEDWIWRYKDLVSWWSQPHHDRPGGVRAESATGWVAMSKPVWLTEVGCPAVDKGSNQPNVFVDPKSSESHLPWFSGGTRDDLVQRRYLEAVLAHWSGDAAANPVSPVYHAPMLAPDRIHVWAWDARPWPDFPARRDVWSDGANWTLGHWLNGRAGQVPVASIIAEICADAGLEAFDVSAVDDLVSGYVVAQPVTARAALEPLLDVLGIDVLPRASALHFASADAPLAPLILAEPVQPERGPATERLDPPVFDRPRELSLDFIDDAADYRPGHAVARGLYETVQAVGLSAPVLADPHLARNWCGQALAEIEARPARLALHVPPSLLALEAGDAVTLDGALWRAESLEGGAARQAGLRPPRLRAGVWQGSTAGAGASMPPPARPQVIALDLPLDGHEAGPRGGVLLAGFADPWPGALDVFVETGDGGRDLRCQLRRPARIGVLLGDLASGPVGYWDEAASVEIELSGGELASLTREAVLNGANRLAVSQGGDEWEVIQFADAELTGERRYRLSGLLRGQGGTRPDGALAGAVCVVLDEALTVLPLLEHEFGNAVEVRAVAAGLAADDGQAGALDVTGEQRDLWPLAPVHVRAQRVDGSVTVSWIRRARVSGDDWRAAEVPLGETAQAYRLEILLGDVAVLGVETAEPEWSLTEAGLTTLLGSLPEALELRVAQISAQTGPGRWTRCNLLL
ncbi:baseplate multidomain protein megatron [Maricaulis salignorans]|uniref:Putative phage tail protein n=1 Tax=Maricaulis salignorans TaxID=144026 RepID=A0A1G9Q3K4_9PROT|nr:glycoside hydrolase/phage tail family protein [Maricaulis salignorans]SDM04915.1 Putative phage tail protein [Maricaulis salignorans]